MRLCDDVSVEIHRTGSLHKDNDDEDDARFRFEKLIIVSSAFASSNFENIIVSKVIFLFRTRHFRSYNFVAILRHVSLSHSG